MKRWIPLAILAACGVLLSATLWPSSASHDDVFTREGLLTANAEDLRATAVTGHLEVPIETGRSVLWCGTFQLVWTEICGLIGDDIHFDRGPPMVAPMNKKAFARKHIDEASYVALAGFVRGRVEQMPALREARTAVAEADNAAAKDDARVARKAFDRAFTHWRTALDKTPGLVLMSDRKTCAELMETIGRYTAVLEQLKETFPQDFPLLDFIRIQIQHADGAGEARQFLANGDKALADQKLAEAHKQYEQALAAWRKVLDKFPPLVQVCDPKTNEKLLKIVDRYRFTLKNLEQKFPE